MNTILTRGTRPCGCNGHFRRRNLYRGGAGIVLASLLLAGVNAVHAADTTQPDRFASLTVYGNDPCPPGTDSDIAVCGREPQFERYRIPKNLRETKYHAPAQSWASRVRILDDASRMERPNSCSVVGAGGQTGCYAHALEQWFAERR
ncbi:hypothetical protein ACM61V_15925 [Sphingomonas sp. TX0543]|uniref:hypothetical protein n=1 Tax=Sphingomonas sp. TX0543 TaxID=3399682 RepID=UPI003AFA754D